MNRADKPKLTSEDLVEVLKEKGITFNLIDEGAAAEYLRDVNNYLRTASYRRNFEKCQMGVNRNKYVRLDFGYLTELSTVDMHMRSILLNMCIDLEHAIKTKLVAAVETNPLEDGYNIVDVFLSQNKNVLTDIENKIDTIFTGKLIDAYFKTAYVVYPETDSKGNNHYEVKILDVMCPIWVLVELLSFGDLLKLVYCYNSYYPANKCDIPKYSELAPVKSLRNACAHNNCLLSDMRPTTGTKPNSAVISYIMKNIPGYVNLTVKKKLSCRPVFEIVSLLINYSSIVSPKVRKKGIDTIYEFVNTRMVKHLDYFRTAKVVTSSFQFLQNFLDNMPEGYIISTLSGDASLRKDCVTTPSFFLFSDISRKNSERPLFKQQRPSRVYRVYPIFTVRSCRLLSYCAHNIEKEPWSHGDVSHDSFNLFCPMIFNLPETS